VEEALSAGIEAVGLVVQTGDRQQFEDFFKTPPEDAYFRKLAPKHAAYMQYLQDVGQRVTILTQEVQEGFGHAVFCARDWVDGEPFLLLLGDHVYASDLEVSCARQIVEVFEQQGKSVIGIEVAPATEITQRGCVAGTWQVPDALLQVSRLAEKPEVEYAQQHLHVAGMPADQLLSIFGLYILVPEIFDYLAEHIDQNLRERDEFQLTSCLDRLRQAQGMVGYKVKGRSFDIGLPDAYYQTLIDFRHV
jgi:UTP--glucose-1-phosphate uridylyltransferase